MPYTRLRRVGLQLVDLFIRLEVLDGRVVGDVLLLVRADEGSLGVDKGFLEAEPSSLCRRTNGFCEEGEAYARTGTASTSSWLAPRRCSDAPSRAVHA
jgi:hypothetical protein